jgi:Fanconi anemia group M protein
MPEIIVDSRESRSPVISALQKTEGVTVVVRELSCGDYLPHPSFGIERKDAQDFVLSVMDRRLFAQVKRMKDEYERVLFLVEGNPYDTRSGMQPEAIRGALSYLMAIEGVSLVTVESVSHTAPLLVTLARHLQEGLGYEVPLRMAKPKNTADLSQYLVEGLPGIGPTTAQTLLASFGSAELVFNASVAELCAVPGIGKKTAERIREALSAKVTK